jgi:hypothetical protein
LAGLQVGDVDLPDAQINPNAVAKPGVLHIERTVITIDGALVYDSPKTKGSRRRVPMTAGTTALLRDYLAAHPRRAELSAPLFCSVTLKPSKPTGKRSVDTDGTRVAPSAVDALAALSTEEAAQRLVLDWSAPYRHQAFYKAVFRPAVARTNRLGGPEMVLPPALKFPRAAPHLRQFVRRRRNPAATAFAFHGTRQGDHHTCGLHPSVR